MPEYIDCTECRDDFYSAILDVLSDDGTNDRANEIIDIFDDLPTADVEPVRHGRWEVGYFHDRVCSCCIHPSNDLSDYPYSYCPNCGAKMDGEDGEKNG